MVQNWAQDNSDVNKRLNDLEKTVQSFRAGTHRFMLAGLAQTSFIKEEGAPSTIETAFEPIFLYRATDKILFEGEIEAEIEDGGQNLNLEYGQFIYIVNDYLTFGAGKFLNPANYFMERLHPAWINKMPDKPFFVHEETTIQAPTHIGFELRGAAPINSAKIEYAAFLGNGPVLNPNDGTVSFKNYGDNNSNKVIGGRVSFLPIPQMEIGYGLEVARTGDRDTPLRDVKAVNNAVDFTFTDEVPGLKGGIDVRAQAVWLTIDNPNMGALTFDNTSVGGYGQIAYHPYNANNNFFKNLEFVYRFDWSNQPDNAPNNLEMKRSGFGLNYWLTSSSELKFAYETNNITSPDGTVDDTENRFIAQVALGF